jgi:hypothetical protein
VPTLCLEEVVDALLRPPLPDEQCHGEQQSDRQGEELRDVRGEEDDHEQPADELPRLPPKCRRVVPILTPLDDSEQDQGENDGKWQGGSHLFGIGRPPGVRNP